MIVEECKIVSNSMQFTNRELTYTARYRIKTDSRDGAAGDVLSKATGVGPNPFPDDFSTFSLYGHDDPSAFMQRAKCDPLDDMTTSIWIADATWSPLKGSETKDKHTSREDPLSRDVIYALEWEEITLPVEQAWNVEELTGISRVADTFGPIQNAAGQEPSTPIVKTKRLPVVVAEKNYATLADINAIEQGFGDSLNDAVLFGYAKGECLFRGINASKAKFEGGVQFYTGAIRIACQRAGWNYEMVNRGWKYLDSGDLKEATVKDANGNRVPVSEPINLELDGSKTADGDIGTVIKYRHRPFVDFGILGI